VIALVPGAAFSLTRSYLWASVGERPLAKTDPRGRYTAVTAAALLGLSCRRLSCVPHNAIHRHEGDRLVDHRFDFPGRARACLRCYVSGIVASKSFRSAYKFQRPPWWVYVVAPSFFLMHLIGWSGLPFPEELDVIFKVAQCAEDTLVQSHDAGDRAQSPHGASAVNGDVPAPGARNARTI
jgi:hypothetical protein